jgi:hypothetical protein
MLDKVKVFLSYSHFDRELKDSFVKQLATLVRSDNITLWTDDHLYGGMRWDTEINQRLLEADLILLLISPNFIASDYCYNIELKQAIQMQKERKAVVVPVGLTSIDFTGLLFSDLQMIPRSGQHPPFAQSWPDINEAFTAVVKEIRLTLNSVLVEMKKWNPVARKNEIRRDIEVSRHEEACNKLIDFVNDFSENESLRDEVSVIIGDYTSLLEDKGKVDYVQFRRAVKESMQEIFKVIDKVMKELKEKADKELKAA